MSDLTPSERIDARMCNYAIGNEISKLELWIATTKGEMDASASAHDEFIEQSQKDIEQWEAEARVWRKMKSYLPREVFND